VFIHTCTGVCVCVCVCVCARARACVHTHAHTFVQVFVRERERAREYQVLCIFDFKLLPCSVCCVFFWVIPRHLNFICRRFGTLCLFHLHRQWTWNRQSVPKRQHIKFRCRGITQKKTYNMLCICFVILTFMHRMQSWI